MRLLNKLLGLYTVVGLGKRHLSLRERSVRYEPGEGVRTPRNQKATDELLVGEASFAGKSESKLSHSI
jgi:hypothetical protein